MGDKREDVRELTKVLKERLKWYQEEATEEEMDPEEICAILALLEKWENPEVPIIEVSDAYTAFCEHYLQTAGIPQPGKRKVYRILRQAAVAVIVVSVLFAALNLGTYATTGLDFFSLLWQRDGEKSFAIMGGENASNEELSFSVNGDTYYSSWEELPQEVLDRICVPKYIPQGWELSSLRYWTDRNAGMIWAVYNSQDGENRLKIWIEQYEDFYAWQQDMREKKGNLTQESIGEQEYYWERKEDEVTVYFFIGEELYTVQGDLTDEEIEKIVGNMQPIAQENE